MRKNDIIYNIKNPDILWRIVRQWKGAWIIEKVGILRQPLSQRLLFFEHQAEWKRHKEAKTNASKSA